jgi:hypothetical protein
MVLDHVKAVTGVDHLIDHIIGNLADVALAMWPAWYGDAVRVADCRLPALDFHRQLSDRLLRADLACRDISCGWAWRASALCRRGKPPRPAGFPPAFHAAQLSRVIEPDDFLIVLGIEAVEPDHLLGLARAVEWFASATAARLLVVIPEGTATADALDGINFGALHWTVPEVRPPGHQEASDECTARVWPTVGKPHPFSPGEQLLALRLADDPELTGLFAHNSSIRSRFGRAFIVDLLWEAGRLIVEIDGYGHHSDRRAFAADRQRDYELSLSGYLTIRLPHDEVMADGERALEKVRNVVRFRRNPVSLDENRPR